MSDNTQHLAESKDSSPLEGKSMNKHDFSSIPGNPRTLDEYRQHLDYYKQHGITYHPDEHGFNSDDDDTTDDDDEHDTTDHDTHHAVTHTTASGLPPMDAISGPEYKPPPRPSSLQQKTRTKVPRHLKTKHRKINREHPEFELTYDMMLGIRTTVSLVEAKPYHPLESQDLKFEIKLRFPGYGSSITPAHEARDFKFKDYMPEVFRHIRARFDIDPAEYLTCVCGNFEFLEFISNSKSGQFFFYSHDRKYMIKTVTQQESKFLRRILPAYYDHILQNPNTLLTRFFGMHRVKPHKKAEQHFLIMGSVFYTPRPIDTVYDLKGSTQGRQVSPEERQRAGCVFKDLDFLQANERIALGPTMKIALAEQLERDVDFLRALGIMDYSLLLGVHDERRHEEEEEEEESTARHTVPPSPAKHSHSHSHSLSSGPAGLAEARSQPSPLPALMETDADEDNHSSNTGAGAGAAHGDSNSNAATVFPHSAPAKAPAALPPGNFDQIFIPAPLRQQFFSKPAPNASNTDDHHHHDSPATAAASAAVVGVDGGRQRHSPSFASRSKSRSVLLSADDADGHSLAGGGGAGASVAGGAYHDDAVSTVSSHHSHLSTHTAGYVDNHNLSHPHPDNDALATDRPSPLLTAMANRHQQYGQPPGFHHSASLNLASEPPQLRKDRTSLFVPAKYNKCATPQQYKVSFQPAPTSQELMRVSTVAGQVGGQGGINTTTTTGGASGSGGAPAYRLHRSQTVSLTPRTHPAAASASTTVAEPSPSSRTNHSVSGSSTAPRRAATTTAGVGAGAGAGVSMDGDDETMTTLSRTKSHSLSQQPPCQPVHQHNLSSSRTPLPSAHASASDLAAIGLSPAHGMQGQGLGLAAQPLQHTDTTNAVDGSEADAGADAGTGGDGEMGTTISSSSLVSHTDISVDVNDDAANANTNTNTNPTPVAGGKGGVVITLEQALLLSPSAADALSPEDANANTSGGHGTADNSADDGKDHLPTPTSTTLTANNPLTAPHTHHDHTSTSAPPSPAPSVTPTPPPPALPEPKPGLGFHPAYSVFTLDDGGVKGRDEKNNPNGLVYYFGIIDILTVYDWKKRGEHFLKSIKFKKEEISAVPPDKYGRRFIDFINAAVD